jgi:hypothetical protein
MDFSRLRPLPAESIPFNISTTFAITHINGFSRAKLIGEETTYLNRNTVAADRYCL